MKQKLIKKIKTILSELDYPSIGEIGSDHSQIYKSMGKDHCMLVEGYNADSITVVEYIHEQQVNEFTARYEDLKGWQLKEIWEQLGEYAASCVDSY